LRPCSDLLIDPNVSLYEKAQIRDETMRCLETRFDLLVFCAASGLLSPWGISLPFSRATCPKTALHCLCRTRALWYLHGEPSPFWPPSPLGEIYRCTFVSWVRLLTSCGSCRKVWPVLQVQSVLTLFPPCLCPHNSGSFPPAR